jgi:NAD-dependent deacetylase
VATSNVDGLHQLAGSQRVFELHGSAWRARCLDPDCPADSVADHALLRGDMTAVGVRKACPVCGGPTRPDATLYGETQQALAEWETKRALREVDVFVAIGTSGVVQPAASYGRWAQENGARCILVNLEAYADPPPWYGETYLGPAEEIVPQLFAI